MSAAVPEFTSFPKIPRLSRDIIVTEKIDGTNAAIWISDDGSVVQAGSRHRWISPGKGTDNFGFAGWVEAWRATLVAVLGPGPHHGEWWGQSIQRGYGLDHKRFSLFNPKHYGAALEARNAKGIEINTVPVLYDGPFYQYRIDNALADLALFGSLAAPGFMQPEGVVVYHTASGHLYKKTIVGDEKPKGSAE